MPNKMQNQLTGFETDQPGVDAKNLAEPFGDFLVTAKVRAFAPHSPARVQWR